MADDTSKKPTLGQLVKTMLGIGCVGFGGGSALIPVLEETLVRKHHFITEDEFNKDIVIASVTPGALPVEISAGVGKQAAGPLGMLASASSISLPGVALTVFGMVGESSFVKLTGLTGTLPSVNLTIINVMAVAFFLLFWTHGDYSTKRVVPGIIACFLYVLGADGSFGLKNMPLEPVSGIAMLVMAVVGLRQEMQGKQHLFDASRLKDLGKEIAAAAGMLVVFCLPAMLVFDGTPEFVGRGILSALTSFGGGDAYLALADGLFVTAGMVLYVDFYNQLVPVANALPGSILCKVLSGMGFFVGYRATNDVMVGLAVALAGFSCSIAMSSTTFSVADFFYSGLEHFRSFKTLKKAISPIIVGLMGSVALNLIRSCTTIVVDSLPPRFAPALCLVLTAANLLVMHKVGNKPLPMVIGMAVISCVLCNVLALY